MYKNNHVCVCARVCVCVSLSLCPRLTNIFDSKGVGFGLLTLVVPVAYVTCVLPPFVLQDLNDALLLQLQNR
jgi:hypothetical protein